MRIRGVVYMPNKVKYVEQHPIISTFSTYVTRSQCQEVRELLLTVSQVAFGRVK